MKIKDFIRRSALTSCIAICIIGIFTLPLAGCISQGTLASLTNTLGTAAAHIATLEGNAALGQKLTTDTAAAVAAVTNWKTGTAADNVIEALSIVEDDLDLFPGTSQYAPLIDLAIGTAQTLIAMLPVPAAPTLPLGTHAHRQVHLGHAAPKNAKAFKSQWNKIVAQNPNLAPAAIQ